MFGEKFFFVSELLMLVKQHSFSNNLMVCTRKRWHGKCLFAIRVKSCVQFCLRSADFFSEHERLGLVLNAHFCHVAATSKCKSSCHSLVA